MKTRDIVKEAVQKLGYKKLRKAQIQPINDLMDGKDILLIPDGQEHFVCTVNVAVSPMFLSWVIGFGSKAKILYPQSVIDACKAMCQEALSQY